jgi:pantoate--beta-alanine ligase
MSEIEVISSPAAMSRWAEAVRARGRRIAFVPTMGALHAGHVALLSAARGHGDVVALSIFVNPIQFSAGEDLARYPRDLAGDLGQARAAGATVAFVPEAREMYPPGYQTFVEVREVSAGLCGESRPGHFVGVASVVCKLLNIVRPHAAVFGEKDFQQLVVIRRMVADLNLPVEVVSRPTVREPDGLAMSSRNVYLAPADRARATCLYQGLCAIREVLAKGERRVAALLPEARAIIEPGVDRIDYLEIRDAENLRPVAEVTAPAVALAAVFVAATRLIDNVRLG